MYNVGICILQTYYFESSTETVIDKSIIKVAWGSNCIPVHTCTAHVSGYLRDSSVNIVTDHAQLPIVCVNYIDGSLTL